MFFWTVLCKTDLIFFNKSVPRPGYVITLPELLTGKYFSWISKLPQGCFHHQAVASRMSPQAAGFLQRRRSCGADEVVQLSVPLSWPSQAAGWICKIKRCVLVLVLVLVLIHSTDLLLSGQTRFDLRKTSDWWLHHRRIDHGGSLPA